MKIGLGIGIPFIRNYISSLFDPSKLFTGSTNGAWYDPSDTTTLYRDAAGTLPVTAVEQPVGLMLDKSKGLVLGPELVTNGDFSNGTTGWTLYKQNSSGTESVAVVNGAVAITVPSGTPSTYCQIISDAFTTVVGVTYRITAGIPVPSVSTTDFYGVRKTDTVLPGSNLENVVGGDNNVPFGTGTLYFRATSTQTRIALQVNRSGLSRTVTFDNISVRELPGNHAFNSSGNSANFPVLSARVNRLTETNPVSGSTWTTLGGVSFSTNSTVAPDGTTTGTVATTTTPSATYYQAVSVTPGEQYTFSMAARRGTMANAKWSVYNASAGSDIVTATSYYGSLNSSTWTRVTLSFTIPAGCTSIRVYPLRDSGSIGTIEVWGADLRAANDALNQPAYQRVNTATDYDTVGFKPYLRFNGTNQWLQTNSIDFTYGDKMFVSAGVRKLSDAAVGVVVELSATVDTNNGSFVFAAPGSAAANYYFGSRGSSLQGTLTTPSYSAPITNVISGVGKISATSDANLRVNATQVVTNNTAQGSTTYGNYPMFLGARAGTSLWFNGRLYGMVVAGKQASAAEITSTETYINQKTGAF